MKVLWLSLLLSTIIGILLGLLSKTKKSKMTIDEIQTELMKDSPMSFSKTSEKDMFDECVKCYNEGKFYSSCTVGMVVYEKIFFSRLLKESYLPLKDKYEEGEFTIEEELNCYRERERILINGKNPENLRGYSFKKVTKELVNYDVITTKQKEEYDNFYDSYRIPVQHGLILRLYENVTGKRVDKLDTEEFYSKELHEIVSEKVIRKIYDLSKIGGLWG